MPKATTQSSTKAASKTANTKTAKTPKEEKAKRPPSAYNVFMKDKLTAYKANHPELSHMDAFKAVAGLWKDAPENPNRGQDTRPKKKSADKENAAAKPKPKPNNNKPAKKEKVVEQSDEEDEGQIGSEE